MIKQYKCHSTPEFLNFDVHKEFHSYCSAGGGMERYYVCTCKICGRVWERNGD